MSQTTIIFIILAVVVAFAISYFQYFYRAKGSTSKNATFGTLRFLSVFGILLLLINPKITKEDYFIEKPNLVLAVDNSASMGHLGADESAADFAKAILTDKELQKRFDIHSFTFGKEMKRSDQFSFDEKQTNIPRVFQNLDALYDQKTAPTILITDGNQTLGEEAVYAAKRFSQPVYPVIAGDTTQYLDLKISRVNFNKYTFLNNRFPIEVFANFSGDEAVRSKLEVISGNNVIFSKEVAFDESNPSEVILAEIPASSVGVHTYEVRLSSLEGEKNLDNNSKRFAIEVIDEKSKVLILYAVLHPDLGAIKKAIESNQQREAIIESVKTGVSKMADFELVILYQPNRDFEIVLEELEIQGQNYWIITGPETDWRFLNQHISTFQQEITNQSEGYFPVYNEDFSAFQIDDIGFSSFPPLQGNFGSLQAKVAFDALLYRKMQGLETSDPLMAVVDQKDRKMAYLFGADIWKWRSHVFQEKSSFEEFDNFINKLVQYLSLRKKKERLSIFYEPLYENSESVIITAEYFDKNFIFDPRANLMLNLKDPNGQNKQLPLTLNKSRYEINLSSIAAGKYYFTVSVEGENLSKSGKFELIPFDVEKQFVRANFETMANMAANQDKELFFLNDFERLKQLLLQDDSYIPVQKSRQNNVPLIDWYYLLGLIALFLTAEWFLRKYYGQI